MRTTLILLAAGSLGLSACSSADGSIGSSGPAIDRSFAVSDFTGVALTGPYRVDIVAGTDFSVTVRGAEEDIDDMSVEVDDGDLTIGAKKNSNWSLWQSKDEQLVVTVTMPEVEALKVSGSGDMTNTAPTASSFEVKVSGSGDLDTGTVKADTVRIAISGSGNITANGSSGTTYVSVSGSGDIDARDLVASDIEVKVRGSGDVAIGARGKAAISVSGSGNVHISGTSDCTISKAGSGEARCD